MKKNIILYLLIIFLTNLFVMLEPVKADCSYSFYYEIENNEIQKGSQNVGTGYIDAKITEVKKEDGKWIGKTSRPMILGIGKRLINSWSDSACPDFIGVLKRNGGNKWHGFTKDEVLNNGASLVDLVDTDHMWVYKNNDLELTEKDYTCEYDNFKITFNSKGYAQYAESKYSNVTVTFLYDLSKRMLDEPVAKAGECEDVYYCLTSGAHTTDFKNYKIFVDEIDYENNKSECQEVLIFGEVFSDSTEDYGSSCRTYDNFINDLKENYTYCLNDKSKCLNYKSLKDKISGFCRSITTYASYDTSACLRKCLNYKSDILNKVETNNEEIDGECGFSGKLIQFIGNIIKWIKYIIPVVVIVLGILDFIKAIAGDKEEEIKKAQGKFVKRLIAAALIFIIPFILEFVLNKMGFDANGCGIIDL